MKARYYLLGCLILIGCEAQLEVEGPVVNFTRPFPATAPDLAGFLPRDRRQYFEQPRDSGTKLIISEKALVKSHAVFAELPGAWLDSVGVPRRSSSYWHRDGIRYTTVRQLAADSFRVRAEVYDTLLSLSGRSAPKLRYHRGWYYLSRPTAEDSTKWEVRRLSTNHGLVVRQLFNPDSLRIRALDPALVHQRRENGQLIFTLTPESRRAIWQVSSYDGLWLEESAYLLSVLGDKP